MKIGRPTSKSRLVHLALPAEVLQRIEREAALRGLDVGRPVPTAEVAREALVRGLELLDQHPITRCVA